MPRRWTGLESLCSNCSHSGCAMLCDGMPSLHRGADGCGRIGMHAPLGQWLGIAALVVAQNGLMFVTSTVGSAHAFAAAYQSHIPLISTSHLLVGGQGVETGSAGMPCCAVGLDWMCQEPNDVALSASLVACHFYVIPGCSLSTAKGCLNTRLTSQVCKTPNTCTVRFTYCLQGRQPCGSLEMQLIHFVLIPLLYVLTCIGHLAR
jgi:hypothetical protein